MKNNTKIFSFLKCRLKLNAIELERSHIAQNYMERLRKRRYLIFCLTLFNGIDVMQAVVLAKVIKCIDTLYLYIP